MRLYVKVIGSSVLSLWLFTLNAVATMPKVQPGDPRDKVLQAFGTTYSVMKFGHFETLEFTNGTRVELQDGLVKKVSLHYAHAAEFGPKSHKLLQALSSRESASKEGGRESSPAVDSAASSPQTAGSGRPEAGSNAVATTSSLGAKLAAVKAAATAPSIVRTNWTNWVAKFPVANVRPSALPHLLSTQFSHGHHVTITLSRGTSWLARLLALGCWAFLLGVYGLICLCFQRICAKAGQPAGILVWIPFLQLIPLLRAAAMPFWTLLLFVVPLVNIVFIVKLWSRICRKLGKDPWLAILLLIPVVNVGFLIYLSFSGAAPPQVRESLLTVGRSQEAVSVS
jgi:hypothetical protein